MFSLGGKVLGLDIGSKRIKWVLYGGSRKKPVLLDWGQACTPPGSVRDGKIIDKLSLKNALEEIVKSKAIEAKKVAVSLSSSEIMVRTVELPKLTKKELDKAVLLEVEHFFSFSTDDYYIDYRILGETRDKQVVLNRVLIAVLPKPVGDTYIEIFEELKLKPIVFDFHGNSYCRLLKHLDSEFSQKGCMIVDMGASSINIAICEGGMPVFYRVIQGGGDEITKAIANSFNLSLEEGEKYKISHGVALLEEKQPHRQAVEIEIVNCIVPVLQYQVQGIYRSLEFYTRRSNKPVDVVILAGGGSRIRNLDRYFSQQLDIDTRYFTCKDNFVRSRKELAGENLTSFNNVFGLAFRGER